MEKQSKTTKAMRIYVSLPISGHDIEKVRAHAEHIKQRLCADGHEVLTPFDVCPDPDRTYSYYMGRDIEALLDCDAVFFAIDWERSSGCRLERAAAEIYGKWIFNESPQA